MKITHLLLIAVLSLPVIFSCKKKEIKKSPVYFYLMDSPTDFDSVNIHIKKIEAKVVSDSTVWIPISTKDTIVNLFHLQDSITMQVAQDMVPLGMLQEIRFVLGKDNAVVVDNIAYPLQMPIQGSPGFLVQINKRLNEVFNGFILDFDLSQSIIQENGIYRLEPVIKLIN
jgi:hypothetical protein